ncbi:hypothetical protein C1646_770777 [Rhizophagus diaphanus]|nr:hypothetical protein C1646_770777 [Rhizophagus diaphanus] [Rhizophagus sp. MUCL 43196]
MSDQNQVSNEIVDGFLTEITSKDEEIESLRKQNKKLDKEIESLRKQNKKLNDENSRWQNYIGKETNFSLNDNDTNHSTHFAKDIENLQKMIVDYIGNLRPKVKINFEEVNKLLRLYGCSAQVKSKEKPKENEVQLAKAVLQRHVFEEVIKSANKYFLKYDDPLLKGNIDKQTQSKKINDSKSIIDEQTNDNQSKPVERQSDNSQSNQIDDSQSKNTDDSQSNQVDDSQRKNTDDNQSNQSKQSN